MHICLLTRITLAHGTQGGMERHTAIVTDALQERGHSVTTVTTSLPDNARSGKLPVDTHYLPGTRPGRYSGAWWRESHEIVERLQHAQSVDLIWSQSIAGFGYLRHLRTDEDRLPFVATMHGTAIGELRSRLGSLKMPPSPKSLALLLRHVGLWLRGPRLWHRVMDEITAAIAVSSAVAKDMEGYLAIPRERIYVVPNGVDVSRFEPRRVPPEAGSSAATRRPSLLYVGRLERDKGLHVALEALQHLPADLVVVGQGSEGKELRRLARHLDLEDRTEFAGFVDHDHLPAYYHAADVVVMPTLREEGMPLALLEAMACGRPVVTSRIGGIPSVVDDGTTGLLVPPGDRNAFVQAVRRLLEDPAYGRRLGAAARQAAFERFSLERMVDETERVFIEALNSERSL